MKTALPHVIGILLFLISAVNAQVNTEKLRRERERSGISGDIEFTYRIARGNSHLTEIGFSPNFLWRSGAHQAFTLNSLERVSSDDNAIINKGFSHLRYNYDFTDVWIYEAFLQLQYNREQGLNRRLLVGTGIRIEAIRRERFLLAVGVAAMLEKERLESGARTSIVRNSNYLNVKYGREKRWNFINTVYVQPKIDNWSDIRVLDEASLSVWLIDNLAATNTLTYHYDAKPPPGIKEYDLEFKAGLKFTF